MRILARLAVLVFIPLGACSQSPADPGDAPTRLIQSLHDLVVLAPLATVDSAGKHLPEPDTSLDWRDNRDGVSLLRGPAGSSITFPPLPVSGSARLSVGCGSSAPPGTVSDPRVVRFLVEAARVDDAATTPPASTLAFFPVGERLCSLEHIELHGPDLLELELPADATGTDTSWVLRFSTVRWITGDGPPRPGIPEEMTKLDWPAWIAPTLASAGRRVPLADDPVIVPDVALDIVSAFDDAAVLVQDEHRPVSPGSINPAPDGSLVVGSRSAIEVPGSSRVRYLLTPQHGDTLRWSIGVDCERGWALGGDGMRFAIEVDGECLWERVLEPASIRSDRGWQPASLDLSRFAGHEIALDLVTGAGPEQDTLGDLGGWAAVRILHDRPVPRLPAGEAPTIVLIVVDTLRADRLGRSGYGAGITPRLDALAARGTDFRAARSTSSWTWPATASILTGLSPAEHGVHDARRALLKYEIDTLAELCQRKGYTTGAFTANLLIGRSNRFNQGFETFALEPNITARGLNLHAVRWLEQTDGLARMLYMHYFDPHAPYAPPPAFLTAPGVPAEAGATDAAELDAELARIATPDGTAPPEFVQRYVRAASARYDAEVCYVDTAIGELLDALAAHGALDDAIVIVTADHGEEFYEHGVYGHGPSLYEETLRVPLILATFGSRFDTDTGARAPGVVTAAVTTRDIVPTLVELAGLPAPAHSLEGVSLLLERTSALSAGPFFSETLLGREPQQPSTVEKLAVFDGRFKLVSTPQTGRVELYDLQLDPRELDDLATRDAERRDALLAVLRADYPGLGASAAAEPAPDAGSEDAIERLQALGYLGR